MSEFIPPTTNEAWNDLIITSGIHIKWHNEAGRPDKYPSSQLDEMLFSHESKAATFKIKKEQAASLLAALETLSSSQINLLLLSGAMGESISTVSEYETEKNADIEKYYALDRIVQLLKKEIEFREAGTFPRDPIGTTYYIDSDNGNDSNDGLGSGGANAWLTISKFIASARSAGDIAICRRGTTANYGTAVTACLSDGQTSNPITLEADYDNVWSDNAASAQTYTLVHGSKTAEASATITGVTAGEWVYNSTDSDDQRLFAYEVVSVSGTTLTLRHPFKGTSGATKTLTIMLANPIYGAGTNDVIYLHEDRYWRFSGIHIYSSYGEGAAFHKTNVWETSWHDSIFQGNNVSCDAVTIQDNSKAVLHKCHIYGYSVNGIDLITSSAVELYDCVFTGGERGLYSTSAMGIFHAEDCEFNSNSVADVDAQLAASFGFLATLRNCRLNSTVGVKCDVGSAGDMIGVYSEDHNGTKGDNRVFGTFSSVQDDTPYIQSDTVTVRSGGSTTSSKITPSTNMGPHDAGKINLLGMHFPLFKTDFPVYANTASRTYTFHVKSAATANWTANPTAAELYIEATYWDHATNNYRKSIRSTGTVSFASETTWQAIAITVAPAQTGLMYLKLVYGKTKEDSKSNQFFLDPLVVVS
jgi:hypothetical protein